MFMCTIHVEVMVYRLSNVSTANGYTIILFRRLTEYSVAGNFGRILHETNSTPYTRFHVNRFKKQAKSGGANAKDILYNSSRSRKSVVKNSLSHILVPK